MIDMRNALDNRLLTKQLGAAGWSPARDVDISRWDAWYEQEGYPRSDLASEILRSFGGLTVMAADHDRAEFGSGKIEFDPEVAATGERGRITVRGRKLGVELWPIGEWVEVYILLIDAAGRVYAEAPGHGFGVLLIGETFPDALTKLVSRIGKLTKVLE